MYNNNYGSNSVLGSIYGCNSTINGASIFLFFVALVVLVIMIVIARLVGKQAEKHGHSFIVWSILGFLTGLFALIPLHIAISAEQEGHNFTLWVILGYLFGVFTLIALETALIAERKGYDFTNYCILGVVFGLIALLVSCFLPDFQQRIAVYKAPNATQTKTINQPSKFAQSVNSNKPNSPAKTSSTWMCSECGQVNVGAAQKCINCYADKPNN